MSLSVSKKTLAQDSPTPKAQPIFFLLAKDFDNLQVTNKGIDVEDVFPKCSIFEITLLPPPLSFLFY